MQIVSESWTSQPDALRAEFRRARPFRHLQLDGFLAPEFAQRLLDEFPDFERGNARNEHGELGGKSVVEQIRELGSAFTALDDLVRSEAFLRWLSQATGIPELRYDPWYFGGGTHDNRHGQELDPHVDFNRHPEDGSHRRLNLIVYLNHGWQDAWGGSLELHSDPRREDDAVSLITPLFNRCVVFETTEHSWHGFSRIQLPEDQRQRSRKSVALYFYTRERPAEEMAPEHSTIYVDRPLPERFSAGHTLDAADVEELRVLLTRRDQHIQRLYADLMQKQAPKPPGGSGALARFQRWPGHARRFAAGSISALNEGWRAREFRAASLKRSYRPFFEELPEVHRERLRAAWMGPIRVWRGKLRRMLRVFPAFARSDLARRTENEARSFSAQSNVHDLPEIFHYWSNRYLLPMSQPFGFENPDQFFAKFLIESAQRSGRRPSCLVSIGSGNCDTEVRVAALMRAAGLEDFSIECLDINETMLERGIALAQSAGLQAHIKVTQADVNRWKPQGMYDGVMANQSLHHVLELEHLFASIRGALAPNALFIASDMIGRNGHQRWPEARRIVEEFWTELPDSYRYNLQLSRQERQFMDWDCALDGFEGIRAQDILPLLNQQFGFEMFLAFGNVIDPFIDRAFGHHFSPERPGDREFIDRVHARDEAELSAGRITPTHMMAVMTLDRPTPTRFRGGLSPQACVRSSRDHHRP